MKGPKATAVNPKERHSEIAERVMAGESYSEIAEAVGLTPQRVGQVSREKGLGGLCRETRSSHSRGRGGAACPKCGMKKHPHALTCRECRSELRAEKAIRPPGPRTKDRIESLSRYLNRRDSGDELDDPAPVWHGEQPVPLRNRDFGAPDPSGCRFLNCCRGCPKKGSCPESGRREASEPATEPAKVPDP